MMRPARQAKSCYRKVNEILTAGVAWIARSDRDRAHAHVGRAAAGEFGHGAIETRSERIGNCG
jgi:hypothetical protein